MVFLRLDPTALLTETLTSWRVQADEREQIDAQAQLLAFDRRNHAGASEALASNLQLAIREEAEELLSEKRVISGAVNIRTNKEKMKVGLVGFQAHRAVLTDLVRQVGIKRGSRLGRRSATNICTSQWNM